MALEMVRTGQLQADDADDSVTLLANDLAKYPIQWIDDAILAHREQSPYWPKLCDLMASIQPRRLAAEAQMAREERFAAQKDDEGWVDDPKNVRQEAVSAWWEVERPKMEMALQEPPRGRKTDLPWHDVEILKHSAMRINQHEIDNGRKPCFGIDKS